MDFILGFTRDILSFFRKWAVWISVGVVVGNAILFVNSAINDIYAQLSIHNWKNSTNGGSFLNSILTIIAMIVPSNITAVLTLVVSIHIMKMGLVIFFFAKKLYWDMLFYLNK